MELKRKKAGGGSGDSAFLNQEGQELGAERWSTRRKAPSERIIMKMIRDKLALVVMPIVYQVDKERE